MPLTAVNFVNKGPVLHNDLLQFFNLFTGVMVDQPVTFKNTVSVGGGQGNTTVPLKLYGATGQTSHLLDLYVDSTQAQPGWGIAATGVMQWGPGGVAPVDTTLSRVGTQNGHATDTAGLLIQPYLDLAGTMQIDGTLNWKTSGGSISQGAAGSLLLTVTQDLQVARNLIITNTALPNGIVTNAKLASDTARANLLTNGGFEIWQRGTSFTGVGAGNAYQSDRWNVNGTGSGTMAISRDTANADGGAGACCSVTYTHVAGASVDVQQPLSAAEYPQLKGRTVTLSARVKTSVANMVRCAVFDGNAWQYTARHTGDGTYQTLTVTATLSAAAAQWYVGAWWDNAISGLAYLDNFMLVVGSQAADYAPLHPADDLARCLRYYERLGGTVTEFLGTGQATNTTQVGAIPIRWKVQKAVTPTVTFDDASQYGLTIASGAQSSATSIGSANTTVDGTTVFCNTTGVVAGNASMLVGSGTGRIYIESNP